MYNFSKVSFRSKSTNSNTEKMLDLPVYYSEYIRNLNLKFKYGNP